MKKHIYTKENRCLKQVYLFIGVMVFACLSLTACKDDNQENPADNVQTVFMYLPWTGDLTGTFYNNIEDFKSAIGKGILHNERVVVFLSTSATQATLFELVYDNRRCVEKQLKSYSNPALTTASGITSILLDVKNYAPATRYSMIIGCHGMGWLPANGNYTRSRFYGHSSDPQYKTDITTLAQGINGAGLKMEYILFDDCYLSTVEVAYDLKEITDYIIASPTEMLYLGMPYDKIAPYLVGSVDYKSITEEFYNFFSHYSTPCGTIAVIKCSELDQLASIMKEINNRFPSLNTPLTGIQRMDGYSPVIFFDFGDYVSQLCTDATLLDQFNQQLKLTITYKKHTDYYYTMGVSEENGKVKINAYSGITTSDPSKHRWTTAKTETAWWKATH